MKLTPQFHTKTWLVTLDDGTTEPFPTKAAAVARYPELAQPVQMSRKQERAQDRREAAQRSRGGWGHSRSGRA